MTLQSIKKCMVMPGNCNAGTWEVISNSNFSDIEFIRGDIPGFVM